ncbi:MAG: hypothetical protein ABIQ09_00810 [Jatrophihabitantaceae bacterium]
MTAEQMAAAGEYLARSGVEGFAGHSGAVRGDCFAAEYAFDPSTGVLTVNPSELPHAFRTAPQATVAPAFGALIKAALQGLPGKYGVYDYVIPTIVNNSGGILTYSTSNATNGTIDITTSKIATGVTAQAFEADSSKLSGTGVGGTCVYTLSDGQTTLNIDYFLNTMYTHTFNAGLLGGNAGKYTATKSNTDPTVDGYTYLTPTVTLTKP